ncbi:hypothetical protein Avbf_15346 [Armadillidium vulgare]|nr:hypothetical protein Avbf_15346 [Armadillidium vulgare]
MHSINNWFLGTALLRKKLEATRFLGTFGDWQPRIEKKTKENLFIQLNIYNPITNFTNLLTMEGRKIEEELNGGDVMRVMCSCTEYQVDAGEKLCSYYGHVPVLHTELTT